MDINTDDLLLLMMEDDMRGDVEKEIEILEGYGDTVRPGDEVKVYYHASAKAERRLMGHGIIKHIDLLEDGDIGLSIDFISVEGDDDEDDEDTRQSHFQLSGHGNWFRTFELVATQEPPF